MLNVLLTGSRDHRSCCRRSASASCGRRRWISRTWSGVAGKGPDAVVIDIRSLSRLPREIAGHPPAVPARRPGDSRPHARLDRRCSRRCAWASTSGCPSRSFTTIWSPRSAASPGPRSPLPVGKTFAMLGAKGGVGGTTVAVNLATSMTLGLEGTDAADRSAPGLRRRRRVPRR